MIILDTDHIVVLKYSRGSEYSTLAANMASSPDQDFVTTAITLEEQLRGLVGSYPPLQRPPPPSLGVYEAE